jgi:hypothetical protein
VNDKRRQYFNAFAFFSLTKMLKTCLQLACPATHGGRRIFYFCYSRHPQQQNCGDGLYK